MNKDIGVLVIHGANTERPDFAADLIEEVNHHVERRHGKDADAIAWQPVYWSEKIKKVQEAYMARARKDNEMDFIRLRRFIVGTLGDAAAYQQFDKRPDGAYTQIHKIVRDRISELHEAVGHSDKPLLVVAHSLGSVIMSNYIWDAQHPSSNPAENRIDLNGRSDFEQMKTLAGFICFGSTLPLFAMAYDPIIPIEFPPSTLPDDLKGKARWLNFYDPDDILGYPLEPIFGDVVNADTSINAGGILAHWNPLSHVNYWADEDFTRPVAKYIAQFLG